MAIRPMLLATVVALCAGFGPAWAQFAVTDPATTGRNAAIASLRNQVLEAVRAQRDRLERMARRLSADTDLQKYAVPEAPTWDRDNAADLLSEGQRYGAALTHGDPSGSAYLGVARSRMAVSNLLAGLAPRARLVIERAMATLDAADSANIAGTHQAGALRGNSRSEYRAIEALESDVLDPSQDQSATAVLDKISGAGVIEARQKQARLQYLTSIVEQLVIDNKRARDTEAALLNMQLHRLRGMDADEDGAGMLAGAGDDLRTWRQP